MKEAPDWRTADVCSAVDRELIRRVNSELGFCANMRLPRSGDPPTKQLWTEEVGEVIEMLLEPETLAAGGTAIGAKFVGSTLFASMWHRHSSRCALAERTCSATARCPMVCRMGATCKALLTGLRSSTVKVGH